MAEKTLWINHFIADLDGIALTIDREPKGDDYFGHLGWMPKQSEAVLCRALERAIKNTKTRQRDILSCKGNHLTYFGRKFEIVVTKYKKGIKFVENGQIGMLRDVTPRDEKEIKEFLSETNCNTCKKQLGEGTTLTVIKKWHEDCHGWEHCECCGPCPDCKG